MLEDKLNTSCGKQKQAQKGKKKNPAKVSTAVGKKQSKSVNVVKSGTTMIARDLMNEDPRHLNAFYARMQTKV